MLSYISCRAPIYAGNMMCLPFGTLDYGIAPNHQEGFLRAFCANLADDLLDFFYYWAAVFYVSNGREVNINHFAALPRQEDPAALYEMQVQIMYKHKGTATYNNALETEQALMAPVKNGDVQAMQHYIDAAPSYQVGIIADKHLRLQKNILSQPSRLLYVQLLKWACP